MDILTLIAVALLAAAAGYAIGLLIGRARAATAEAKAERLPQVEGRLMEAEQQLNGLNAQVASLNTQLAQERSQSAEKLARLVQGRGQCPDLFVQVNTGSEPQKAGILPGDADAFIASVRAMDLPLAGLMCIPPDGEDSTPHFAALADMAARNGLSGLSMGMSGDFIIEPRDVNHD